MGNETAIRMSETGCSDELAVLQAREEEYVKMRWVVCGELRFMK
jgi:hypothetical protein